MALFGVERFGAGADAFGVYFGLFARISPLHVRDRVLRVRRPLAGLDWVALSQTAEARLSWASSGTMYIAELDGTVAISSDGASALIAWARWAAGPSRSTPRTTAASF